MVIPANLPSVQITSPLSGTVSDSLVSAVIEAVASDIDGTVKQVEFFAKGMSIETANFPPFQISWLLIGWGIYNLNAKAMDDEGNLKASSPVVVAFDSTNNGRGVDTMKPLIVSWSIKKDRSVSESLW